MLEIPSPRLNYNTMSLGKWADEVANGADK